MGERNWVLGIQTTFTEDGITLSQMTFIYTVLNSFPIQDDKHLWIPIDPNDQLKAIEADEQSSDTTAYHRICWSLIYCVSGTRPDLAYTVTHICQFNSSPLITLLSPSTGVL